MCKESGRQQPAERRHSPNGKKNNKKNRNSSQPSLKEPWRTSPAARNPLGVVGAEKLQGYLNEEIRVVPQLVTPELPVLAVTPAELIRHVLATLASTSQSIKAANAVFVEVYGGVAQAVVAADAGCEDSASTPTDFDARFYIPKGNGDGREFDKVRFIVEDYLLMKLRLAVPADSELKNADHSVVRFGYYQKQCMIGGTFSLLSIGDPATGKALDLEFSCNNEKARKYFDEANSFVIPLTLQQLAGVAPANVMSMTGSYSRALELMQRRELLVNNPEEVINGLALFAHAITDKRLRPIDSEGETAFGRCMVKSFLESTAAMQARYEDPLRFVRSFLRSHYTARPISALATVVQLSAELSAHADAEAKSENLGDESDPNSIICLLADLLSDLFLQAVEASNGSSSDLLALLQIACFLRASGGASEHDSREVPVQAQSGRQTLLLRKTGPSDWGKSLCVATSQMLQDKTDEDEDTWNVHFESVLCKLLSDSARPLEPATSDCKRMQALFSLHRTAADTSTGFTQNVLPVSSAVMLSVQSFREAGEVVLGDKLLADFFHSHAQHFTQYFDSQTSSSMDLSELLKDHSPRTSATDAAPNNTNNEAAPVEWGRNASYWGGEDSQISDSTNSDLKECVVNSKNMLVNGTSTQNNGPGATMKRAIQLLESYAEERNEEVEREEWEKGMYPFCCRPCSGGSDDGPSNDPSGSPTTITMSPISPRATLWRLRRAMLQQAG